jgi:hypothetical protein
MPLSEEARRKLSENFQNRVRTIEERNKQGLNFSPQPNTYNIMLMEIPGAPDMFFLEHSYHSYPGDGKGSEICGRSIGRPDCLICSVIERMAETQDLELLRILNEMKSQAPRYAFKIIYQSPTTGAWLGPVRWSAKASAWEKVVPCINLERFGDPTEKILELRFVNTGKFYKAHPIIDLVSCLCLPQSHPFPIAPGDLKDVDVMRLTLPRSDEDIWERLTNGPLGPYLRSVNIEDSPSSQSYPAVEPPPPPPPRPAPAPVSSKAQVPETDQDARADLPSCFGEQWVMGDAICSECPVQDECAPIVQAKSAPSPPPPPPPAKQKLVFRGKGALPEPKSDQAPAPAVPSARPADAAVSEAKSLLQNLKQKARGSKP